jgi:hypothetical protein
MSNPSRARSLKSLFKREDVDYPGVVVPLDQASHRASVVSEKSESDSNSGVNVGLTTETLKAEIEKDLAANDQHSAYDRMFCDQLIIRIAPFSVPSEKIKNS